MLEQQSINSLPLIKKNIVKPELVSEWEKWFIFQKYSINALKSYYSYLKKFVGFEIEVTQRNVDKFRELNFNSVSSSALKSFFKFLVYKKEFPSDLLLIRFERNKQTRKKPQSITKNEVELLIESMGQDSLRDKMITLITYELGLRISESIKLKWENFNFKEWLLDTSKWGKVEIRNTKGGKFRVLPVKPELMEKLYQGHLERSTDGIPIGNMLFESENSVEGFINNKEQKIDFNLHDYVYNFENLIRKKLNKVSKEVLNKKVNPHTLRHSKAQHLLDSGMPITSIKEILGHVSISTTQIYAQASPEMIKSDLIKYDN